MSDGSKELVKGTIMFAFLIYSNNNNRLISALISQTLQMTPGRAEMFGLVSVKSWTEVQNLVTKLLIFISASLTLPFLLLFFFLPFPESASVSLDYADINPEFKLSADIICKYEESSLLLG